MHNQHVHPLESNLTSDIIDDYVGGCNSSCHKNLS